MTQLQRAAYDAERSAGLQVGSLAQEMLAPHGGMIRYTDCRRYIHAVQTSARFVAAFARHVEPVDVVGGRGLSQADRVLHRIKIGTDDRLDVVSCQRACLHELAHIVTADHGPSGERREPEIGRRSSKGHHHAWRVNFVTIVEMTLGRQAASQLRREFVSWGLPTAT